MRNHDQILPGARVLNPINLLLFGCLLAACAVPEASASPAAAPQATVEGGLDKPAVREVVRAHIDDVRECYNAELIEDDTVGGHVIVSFVVQPDGSASEVVVPESTMPERFDACVTTIVAAWTFPAADAETRVSYPFNLSAG
jgi:outer membrane biosynthesis protein TonB